MKALLDLVRSAILAGLAQEAFARELYHGRMRQWDSAALRHREGCELWREACAVRNNGRRSR